MSMTLTATADTSAILSEDIGPSKILPHHWKELHEGSGLGAEMIEAAGIYSETSNHRLAAALNRNSWSRKQGPAIVFPYCDGNGTTVLLRLKPDYPQTDRKGKAAKYLSPTGSSVRVYLPPGIDATLTDASRPIIITEGEKKTLKAMQEGFPTIGLMGVDCWHARKSSALISDLARIEWNGRPVFIAFDSDAPDNENVQNNQALLGAVLKNHGAVVKIIRFEPGPAGEKVGLDDYLVAHPVEDFYRLLAGATEPEEPDAGTLLIDSRNLDPAEAAKDILSEMTVDGACRLLFWRGSFWKWARGAYRELQGSETRAYAVQQLNQICRALKGNVVSDVLDQLRAQALLPFNIDSPAWIGDAKQEQPDPNHLLVARNGIVNLPALIAGDEHFAPPTPRLFTTTALDYDFSASAPAPMTWLAFLTQLWEGDLTSVSTLQEWFGYCLTRDTRLQKILMMVGPKRSGKGTISRINRALIGPANVAAPTLASLGQNFGLQPLLEKSLAIISDARLSGRTDQAVVVERLLSISGEDAQTIDRKFLEPVTCKLPTRLMVISNELPRLGDSSGALVGRLILLRLTRSFYGHEDPGLTDRLLAELPGILIWAIAGWRRLNERGHFVQPDAARELLGEMEDLSSPIGAFIRERCALGPYQKVGVDSLFSEWRRWCDENGKREPGTIQLFGRDLAAAVPTLRRVRHREGECRERSYEGIGLVARA